MFSSFFRSALCALIAVPLAVTIASAETPQGQFAIEGAGLATCTAFVEARKGRTEARTKAEIAKSQLDETNLAGVDAYARFIGWVEGYLTATNRYVGDTYDMAPWQTPELYGVIIGEYCEKHLDERLFSVIQKIVISLTPDRLKEPSEMVTLRVRNRGFVMYTEVIRRTQDALKKQNLFQGEATGRWDQATQLSIANYQAAVGLQDTGMPDPLTLWLLFSPQTSQADAIAARAAATKAAK